MPDENWSGSKREFRQNQGRTSAPRVWTVEVVGSQVITSWGQMGGKMQTATETCKGVNIGRSNEKSPEVYALEVGIDLVRRKRWEGYREHDIQHGHLIDTEVETTIDFDDLPKNLCFYKPDNSMGKLITTKAEAGLVWYSRKRDGECFIIARGLNQPKLYSRRMLRQHHLEEGGPYTWDDRFPHIVEATAKVMPTNSILLGEMVVDRGGLDGPYELDSLLKQLTPDAILASQHLPPARYYMWDVAFWDGQNMVGHLPVRARYQLLHEMEGGEFLLPPQFFDKNVIPTPAAGQEMAKTLKWEGWVVVDPEGIYGDKAFNFRGKPDRPGTVCAKLKPEYEDDFVAFWDPDKGYGKRSTKERYKQGIHSVALYQYNSKGELVFICLCGSGMTEKEKTEWADPKLFPMVWKVEFGNRRYQSQGDDTDALDHPRLLNRRLDKQPEECVNPKL